MDDQKTALKNFKCQSNGFFVSIVEYVFVSYVCFMIILKEDNVYQNISLEDIIFIWSFHHYMGNF